jgi:osmoprotectant transport system substrate-binding protein
MRKFAILATLAASALALSGCALSQTAPGVKAGAASDGPLKGTSVTVGSKEFTEQLVLCAVTAQRLASQGAKVKRDCGINGSSSVRTAETSGDIDLYWEYTGTAWISYLKQTTVIPDQTEQFDKVRDMDLGNGIVWLPQAEANDTYAVAVKTATAKQLDVKTISDYAALTKSAPAKAEFCLQAEFNGRDDGWPGLVKKYGITLPASGTATLDEGAIPNAISKGNPCAFGVVTSTDGRIPALGLTVLKDDKHFFPFYNLSLTVRQDFLKKNPKVKSVMAPITALLSTSVLQKLNASVDVDGETPAAVAKAWLAKNDLS